MYIAPYHSLRLSTVYAHSIGFVVVSLHRMSTGIDPSMGTPERFGLGYGTMGTFLLTMGTIKRSMGT